MIFFALYLLVGLIVGRVVRGRVNLNLREYRDEVHHYRCGRLKGKKYQCNKFITCNQGHYERNLRIILLLATPFVWPLVLIAGFVLAEKLPKPSVMKSREEKFAEILTNDPHVASAFADLTKNYGV